MIVIPTGTDAPIYHWPYATVGLIVVNVVLFFAVPPVSSSLTLDENENAVEDVENITNFDRFSLALGDGRLHPLQWVTHNFLHYGFIHLAGNMLFLWSFGIVVEGKLGAIKYLLAYLAIGTLHGALVQTLLLRSGLDAHAAGASAIIYGLLAICMIWAPRNELNSTVIILAGFRTFVFHWDLYYTTVALLYIGEQVLNLVIRGALGGSNVVTEMGHLSGACWGAVVGVVLLKAGLVDCEQWDIFSLWARHKELGQKWKERGERLDRQKESLRATLKAEARARSATRAFQPAAEEPNSEERAAAAVRRVRSLIEKGEVAGALAAYDKAARTMPDWPSQPELYALIKAMHERGSEPESIRLMRDHCRYYSDKSDKMRLKLAQILLRYRSRPAAALHVLQEIPPGSLPADLERARQVLARQAQKRSEEGEIEVAGDD